jgi:hypothetical protein
MLREIKKWERAYLSCASGCGVFTLPGYRVNLLVARGQKRQALTRWFSGMMRHLAAITATAQQEPLLNLVVTFDQDGHTVYCFPRSKHRPACYYAEGEARLTISPAAIDLAGVIVAPEAGHFARLSEERLAQIYAEVTLDEARFAELIARLSC